ncbi:MAG: hypothetical protein JWR75_390 [Devosia sp.]|nr:hypothetical protein [Devosia sp.]
MHLIKLCVGVATVAELESYRSERAHWWGLDYGDDVHVHRTRSMPRRAAEIEALGSIYWVMSGMVSCRQPILRLAAAVDRDGRPCCDIIMAPDIVRTEIRPMRPFQGWRYLIPDDAPSDVAPGLHDDGAAYIAFELQKLGLL